jgi:16S rRNA (guanine527-N7)-methyltransferase
MAFISPDLIRKELKSYSVEPDDGLCESISHYIFLLLKWNQKISLTTITNPAEILRLHFGESFFGGMAFSVSHGRLADVGSGAGFPGIPLKLLHPQIDLLLIESNSKKATFLSEVIREIGLSKAEVFRGRMENLPSSIGDFDFVTARALGQTGELLDWANMCLAPAGKVILWLGLEDAEAISKTRGWAWSKPIIIPRTRSRVVLRGQPECL